MKQFYFFLISAVTFFLFCHRASAQIDVDSLLYNNSISKLIQLYGEPIERNEFEGEGGVYITMAYSGIFATICKDNSNLDHIYIWTPDLCVLSSVVPGGIKVGDSVEKYKDIDFSKAVTGKHYESCGFIPLAKPYKSRFSSDIYYNYEILSRGKPYFLKFATENGIIKEIQLWFPDDPAPDSYYENGFVTDEELLGQFKSDL